MNMTFWKTFWASLLASVVSGIIVLLVFFLIVNMMLSSFKDMLKEEDLVVKEKTVLHMTLDGPIGDYSEAHMNTGPMEFSMYKQLGLVDILYGIDQASKDDKIEGIFLNCDGLKTGYANAKEIREALQTFQDSGKWIVSYHENYSTKGYYVSSVAEELYVFPSGMLKFMGLGSERMYFKNALEMLDVKMQIIRGSNNKFKSFVEPYTREDMSDPARVQSMTYLNAIWNEAIGAISKSRGIKKSKLNEIADSLYIRKSGDAVDYKMADGIRYYDEILDTLRGKVGLEEDEELELLSFERYATTKFQKKENASKLDDKNLAVIFAEGTIVDGWGGPGVIGTSLAADIRDVREDDNIKAVVLRINSGGGSALTSDIIWREVVLCKKEKPFIVSMGDVAASGGYYIACAADKIYAQPTTITGSIGVFGIIPYLGDLYKNHLGITFDRVHTNAHAPISENRLLEEGEIKIVQEEIDDIYTDFITKVAKGREMKKSEVDSIGQGRVWAGTDAKKIGLVDEFGGLQDAMNEAIKRGKIHEDSIQISYYPKSDDKGLVKLLKAMNDAEQRAEMSSTEMRLREIYSYLTSIGTKKSIQARMEYLLWIE